MAIDAGASVCGSVRSKLNAAGAPALVPWAGSARSFGENGTLSQFSVPLSGPQSLSWNGNPGATWLSNEASLNTPGLAQESILSLVVKPTPGAVHEVGLRRNALGGAPLAHAGPPCVGGA